MLTLTIPCYLLCSLGRCCTLFSSIPISLAVKFPLGVPLFHLSALIYISSTVWYLNDFSSQSLTNSSFFVLFYFVIPKFDYHFLLVDYPLIISDDISLSCLQISLSILSDKSRLWKMDLIPETLSIFWITFSSLMCVPPLLAYLLIKQQRERHYDGVFWFSFYQHREDISIFPVLCMFEVVAFPWGTCVWQLCSEISSIAVQRVTLCLLVSLLQDTAFCHCLLNGFYYRGEFKKSSLNYPYEFKELKLNSTVGNWKTRAYFEPMDGHVVIIMSQLWVSAWYTNCSLPECIWNIYDYVLLLKVWTHFYVSFTNLRVRRGEMYNFIISTFQHWQ